MRRLQQRVYNVCTTFDHDAQQPLGKKRAQHIFPREARTGIRAGAGGRRCRNMHVFTAMVVQKLHLLRWDIVNTNSCENKGREASAGAAQREYLVRRLGRPP